MKQHWLDIQSFFADQRWLSAIDDLAIATKFELAGIEDAERRELADKARRELGRLLQRLGEAADVAEVGVVKGVDPRFRELLDAYSMARKDTSNYRSTLVRLGAEAAAKLLDARDKRARRELLESLNELRRIIERHQQTDVSAILEEI